MAVVLMNSTLYKKLNRDILSDNTAYKVLQHDSTKNIQKALKTLLDEGVRIGGFFFTKNRRIPYRLYCMVVE